MDVSKETDYVNQLNIENGKNEEILIGNTFEDEPVQPLNLEPEIIKQLKWKKISLIFASILILSIIMLFIF